MNNCIYVENNKKKYGMLEPVRKRELICNDSCEGEDIFKVNNNCYKCNDLKMVAKNALWKIIILNAK